MLWISKSDSCSELFRMKLQNLVTFLSVLNISMTPHNIIKFYKLQNYFEWSFKVCGPKNLSVLDNFSDSTQLVKYSIILKKVTKLFNFSRNAHPGWMSHDLQDSPIGWACFSNLQGECAFLYVLRCTSKVDEPD